jgi:hypothetical protein
MQRARPKRTSDLDGTDAAQRVPSRTRLWRAGFMIAIALVIVFAGNAVARPGCSLLPVPLPTDPNRFAIGTREQACAALGRPMPEVRSLPLGLHETAISVAGPPPVGPDNHRFVSVFYAIGSPDRSLIELRSSRGDEIPPGNVGEVNGQVNGAPAIIDERTFPAQSGGSPFTIVFYMWPRDGLLHWLSIRLDEGITREMADRMAASVR